MLKIKDNVDLKELEKFGFVEDGVYSWKYQHRYYEVNVLKLKHPYGTGRIFIYLYEDYANVPSVIFDLIQAGLVEKVGK